MWKSLKCKEIWKKAKTICLIEVHFLILGSKGHPSKYWQGCNSKMATKWPPKSELKIATTWPEIMIQHKWAHFCNCCIILVYMLLLGSLAEQEMSNKRL